MLAFRASESALWMGTSTFGLFMSNVFPTSVALAEQYFNVTGLSNSCLAGEGRGYSRTLIPKSSDPWSTLLPIYRPYLTVIITLSCTSIDPCFL